MSVEHDVSLSTLTTLQVGGKARTVVRAETADELIAALTKETEPFFIVGGGSNVLARDSGYEGTIYIPTGKAVTIEDQEQHVLITAEAGVPWDAVVARAVNAGWWGIENLSAIPGTVGGAVVQNIGAYGAVLASTVDAVHAFDMETKKVCTFTKGECAFGYRSSVFKTESPRYVVLSATFKLSKKPKENITYKDLAQHFAGTQPTLQSIRDAVSAIRAQKFPDLTQYGTAGSFFLNPVVSEKEAHQFQAQFPDMPLFPLPEGGVKVPLAWILDTVIAAKQLRVGGAFVWPKQALVIATESAATADDVRTLATLIQEKVFEKTNLTITPEVCIM